MWRMVCRCKPDVRLCTEVISFMGKQGMLEDAEDIFEYMRLHDLQPDVFTYTALMHAYSQQSLWEKAEEVLR